MSARNTPGKTPGPKGLTSEERTPSPIAEDIAYDYRRAREDVEMWEAETGEAGVTFTNAHGNRVRSLEQVSLEKAQAWVLSLMRLMHEAAKTEPGLTISELLELDFQNPRR